MPTYICFTNHKEMDNTRRVVCVVLLVAMASCAGQIYSDRDSAYPFTQIKTFAWYPKNPVDFKSSEFDNQIIESNIKNIASAELKRRGLKVSIDSPDVILDYQIMIEQKVETVQTPVYNSPYNYGYNNPYRPSPVAINTAPYISGYTTQQIPYNEGTLTILMIERKSNRMIWRGWSESTVTDGQTYESEMHEDIIDIFKRFPLKKLKRK